MAHCHIAEHHESGTMFKVSMGLLTEAPTLSRLLAQRVQCASTRSRSLASCWTLPITQSTQICSTFVPAAHVA